LIDNEERQAVIKRLMGAAWDLEQRARGFRLMAMKLQKAGQKQPHLTVVKP
jgi:hypothetical protein